MALTKAKASNILLTTPAASSNDVTPATTQYVTTALANLADSAPATLNTLNELAAALGDDANFSTTVTNSIATKLPLAGGTLTGLLTAAAKLKITDVGNTTVAALQLTDAGLGISSPSADQMNFITADTTRMIIDSSGNVGIGTSSPSGPLNVHSASGDANLYVTTGNTAASTNIFFGDSGNSTIGRIVYDHNGDYMKFRTNGSDAMRIDSSGRVGIGTNNPAAYDTDSGGISADLVVANTGHAGIVVASGASSDAGIFFGDGGGGDAYKGAISYVNSQDRLYMKANGVNKATLDTDRFTLLCSQLVTPNFWIGAVPSTSNNNNGAVLLVNLTTANANNVGFQFSGSIIGNSYTGQAFVNVNIVKNYSNDAVAFDVADDQNLNSVVTRMQLNLCTITYSGTSYLAIVKNGGGTGTISLNGYFQGWDSSVIQEVSSGNYSITTNHGNLNF